MMAFTKVLAGGAGVAALLSAAPAAAQYYPQPGYGYNNNVVGQVLGQILNPYGGANYNNYGGNYGGNDRVLVDRCAGAVQQRINARYGGGYQQYGQQYGYGQQAYGYGQPYGYNNQGYGAARVLGITRVERRNSGIRVRGVATAGMNAGYGNPYGGYNQYNQGGGEFTFKCNVDYRGRITDIDLDRNRYAYRR